MATGSGRTRVGNWSARGAYRDMVRVEFPEGFAFPDGTNLVKGVWLMAWGELRDKVEGEGGEERRGEGEEERRGEGGGGEERRGEGGGSGEDGGRGFAAGGWGYPFGGADSRSGCFASLPREVSVEPDASSVEYGLTASNSFVFAWQNCCVEREGTNRVDASIELFDWGDMTIRFGSFVTNVVARPPEGFVGEGQNDDWIAANWPGQYAAITNKGYDAWLMEDYVGINEQNGRYKVDVTVSQLPQNGPCYLVVGPHRMTVTSPGTYSFPLEVDTDYLARTYPVAVPLSFSYDDGYRYEFDEPYPRLYGAPRLLGAPRNDDNIYHINQSARAVVHPSIVYLGEPFDGSVFIWCNKAGATRGFWSSIGDSARVAFVGMTEAEIDEIVGPTRITFYWDDPKGHSEADVDIYQSLEIMHDYDEDDTNDTVTVDGTNGFTSVSRSLNGSFATRWAQRGHKGSDETPMVGKMPLLTRRLVRCTSQPLSGSDFAGGFYLRALSAGRRGFIPNLLHQPQGFLVMEMKSRCEIDDGAFDVALGVAHDSFVAECESILRTNLRDVLRSCSEYPTHSSGQHPHRDSRCKNDSHDAAGFPRDDEEFLLRGEDGVAFGVVVEVLVECGEPCEDVVRTAFGIGVRRDVVEALERGEGRAADFRQGLRQREEV